MLSKLNGETSRNPKLVLCDHAFETRNINLLADPERQHDNDICKLYFQDQSKINLQVLGGTLISQYTHYQALVGKKSSTTDYAYDALEVKTIKNSPASLKNAGSYYNFATEVYWRWHCDPATGRPLINGGDFSGTLETQKINPGISDAFEMVRVLLKAFRNERQLFMNVYNKYFPPSDSDGGEPHPAVMGWSSLSYIYLKNINMYSSWLPEMKLTLLYVSPICRDLRTYRR